MRKLLKTLVVYNGNKGWTLKNSEGEKTFYGSKEEFVTLLKRLKVSDDTMDPRSHRNLKYMDILNGVLDKTSPCIWIWSNHWNKTKKMVLNK